MVQKAEARPQRTAEGIALILGSVLAMATADAVVKLVSAEVTLWQLFTARALVAIPVLIALARASGLRLRLRAPGWALLRSGLLVLTWLVYYAALPVLSLSTAAVAIYTGPILIALFSAALIGEAVTARQWAGVLIGFVGVMAILQPGGDAFSWFTLLPLLGAVFYALAMVLTRSKCQDEAPLTLVLVLHGAFLFAGLAATGLLAVLDLGADTTSLFPFLLGDWQAMGLPEWGFMALLGLLSAAYFVGVARAYQIAQPSIIATFDYAYLVWASLWGFVLFAERPGPLTIAGMVSITLAGLLVAAPSPNKMAEDTARP
ncbi:DMT family transporter [Pelagibius sp.]|uniref:DMT family transporter n=1 Tax=Pelagibius sp. TaxID=1931238 RepID=UPI002626E0F5|nr:DMT family transporter [Pelagibius sp.]